MQNFRSHVSVLRLRTGFLKGNIEIAESPVGLLAFLLHLYLLSVHWSEGYQIGRDGKENVRKIRGSESQ